MFFKTQYYFCFASIIIFAALAIKLIFVPFSAMDQSIIYSFLCLWIAISFGVVNIIKITEKVAQMVGIIGLVLSLLAGIMGIIYSWGIQYEGILVGLKSAALLALVFTLLKLINEAIQVSSTLFTKLCSYSVGFLTLFTGIVALIWIFAPHYEALNRFITVLAFLTIAANAGILVFYINTINEEHKRLKLNLTRAAKNGVYADSFGQLYEVRKIVDRRISNQ